MGDDDSPPPSMDESKRAAASDQRTPKKTKRSSKGDKKKRKGTKNNSSHGISPKPPGKQDQDVEPPPPADTHPLEPPDCGSVDADGDASKKKEPKAKKKEDRSKKKDSSKKAKKKDAKSKVKNAKSSKKGSSSKKSKKKPHKSKNHDDINDDTIDSVEREQRESHGDEGDEKEKQDGGEGTAEMNKDETNIQQLDGRTDGVEDDQENEKADDHKERGEADVVECDGKAVGVDDDGDVKVDKHDDVVEDSKHGDVEQSRKDGDDSEDILHDAAIKAATPDDKDDCPVTNKDDVAEDPDVDVDVNGSDGDPPSNGGQVDVNETAKTKEGEEEEEDSSAVVRVHITDKSGEDAQEKHSSSTPKASRRSNKPRTPKVRRKGKGHSKGSKHAKKRDKGGTNLLETAPLELPSKKQKKKSKLRRGESASSNVGNGSGISKFSLSLGAIPSDGNAPSHAEEADIFESISLSLTLPSGEVELIDVSMGHSVQMIKKQLRDEKGIPFNCIFQFQGKDMMDPLSLNDFPGLQDSPKIKVLFDAEKDEKQRKNAANESKPQNSKDGGTRGDGSGGGCARHMLQGGYCWFCMCSRVEQLRLVDT